MPRYGTSGFNVKAGNYHLGDYSEAILLDPLPAGPYTVGFNYTRVTETLPPHIEDAGGSHYGERMRIMRADVAVVESVRFAANGYELSAYQVTDDFGAAPPLRSGAQKFTFLGWRVDPTISFTQPDPGPLTIPGVRMVVAY